MREIRMEVVSYEEAVQLCNSQGWAFDKVYAGQGSNYGKLMMLAYDNPCYSIDFDGYYSVPITKQPEKSGHKYGVATRISSGSLMFWAKNGIKSKVTFKMSEAKELDYLAAKSKAHFMSSHGGYDWFPVKLK